MIEDVEFGWQGGALDRPAERYGLLERGRRLEATAGARVLAFGIRGGRVRLLLEGAPEAVTRWVRSLRSATTRSLRRHDPDVVGTTLVRLDVDPSRLTAAVAEVHGWAGDGAPLATPWSSHRDLMGCRRADFYDARRLTRHTAGAVDPCAVHRAAGGGRLPPRRTRADPGGRPALGELLRVCGGVRGVLPADRRCFGLFAQAGRRLGHRQVDLADALALTPRRVRQLQRDRAPRLPLAMRALQDPRLRIVP